MKLSVSFGGHVGRFLLSYSFLLIAFSSCNPDDNAGPLPSACIEENFEAGLRVGSPHQFISCSENAVSWLWDFGSGVNSTEENPVITLKSYGSFQGSLKVTNATGQSAQQVFSFNVDGTLGSELESADCSEIFSGLGEIHFQDNEIYFTYAVSNGIDEITGKLTKTDKFFNKAWTVDLYHGTSVRQSDIISSGNGSILISTVSSENETETFTTIYRAFSNGDVTEVKTISAAGGEQALSTALHDNGSFIFTGYIRNSAEADRELMLWKVDQAGNTEQTASYSFSGDIIHCEGKKIVDAGDSYLVPTQFDYVDGSEKSTFGLIFYSENLEQIKTLNFENSEKSLVFLDLVLDGNDIYIMYRMFNSNGSFSTRVEKTDRDGVVKRATDLTSQQFDGAQLFLMGSHVFLAGNEKVISLDELFGTAWEMNFEGSAGKAVQISNDELVLFNGHVSASSCGSSSLTIPALFGLDANGTVWE